MRRIGVALVNTTGEQAAIISQIPVASAGSRTPSNIGEAWESLSTDGRLTASPVARMSKYGDIAAGDVVAFCVFMRWSSRCTESWRLVSEGEPGMANRSLVGATILWIALPAGDATAQDRDQDERPMTPL